MNKSRDGLVFDWTDGTTSSKKASEDAGSETESEESKSEAKA
jgi:hypothetical protein